MKDSLTHDGARRLAIAIEAHWASQGYDVRTRIEEQRHGKVADSFFIVRSDMMDGLPSRKLKRQ